MKIKKLFLTLIIVSFLLNTFAALTSASGELDFQVIAKPQHLILLLLVFLQSSAYYVSNELQKYFTVVCYSALHPVVILSTRQRRT